MMRVCAPEVSTTAVVRYLACWCGGFHVVPGACRVGVERPPLQHRLLVWNKSAAAVAADDSVDVAAWNDAFSEVIALLAPRFTRYEPLRHAVDLIAGLVSGLDRKNCWTIAEYRGHATPDALQHLLSRAKWDPDLVRDDLRRYVLDHLGDPGAILVLDETGDLKKGTETVGVQRQYTGTAGRIENSQVAVYLAYAAPAGHALIDRALYLPKAWTEDTARCTKAGIPDDVAFATKPQLAATMITRAVTAGTPASWVTGDEVYGADPHLRQVIRGHGLGYVLAISANRRLPTHAGKVRADQLTAKVPARAWQRLSAGQGSKGHRYYSWAQLPTDPDDPDDSGEYHLLVRRNDTTGEMAYYRCYSLTPVPLAVLVRVAGQRWRIEESFQTSKTLAGLDEHQVRRWGSWHRWTTLAMLAHAFLTITTATTRTASPAPSGLIQLTVAEFRRLFTALLLSRAPTQTQLLAWSHWRRRHQHRARTSHYKRRGHQ